MRFLSACFVFCLVLDCLGAEKWSLSNWGPVLTKRFEKQIAGFPYLDMPVRPMSRPPFDEAGPDRRCNQDATMTSQNEISVAAWRENTDIVLAGANDYRQGMEWSAGFYRSIDGGVTWEDALVTQGPERYELAGDPIACIDNSGRMYAVYLALEFSDMSNGIYVQSSVDTGQTWREPVAAWEVINEYPTPLGDKPMAAVDLSYDSPFEGNIYVTWSHMMSTGTYINFAASSDHGESFSDPLPISTSSNTHMSCPAVGPNGEIYAVWYERIATISTIRFDCSFDGGITWGDDIAVAPYNDIGYEVNPCGDFRTPSYPTIACDISNGPRRGWIYVCWSDWNGTDSDILLCRSEDGGFTWSDPVRVNDDETDTWQWWSWIAVHPSTGDLGCSWLDRREDPQGCLYRSWGSISYDGGLTWIENMPIASDFSDPQSIEFLGDYCGLTFKDGGFYAGWTDARHDDGDCYVAWFREDAPKLTLARSGNDIQLNWTPAGIPDYNVYYSNNPSGPFHNFAGTTTDTFFIDENAILDDSKRFYQVITNIDR